MKYYLDKRGDLWCEDIQNRDLTFRNFSGVNLRSHTKYPGPDNKTFAVIIRDNDFAQELLNNGWPLKLRVPNVEYDPDAEPYYYLPAKIKFKDQYGKYFNDGRRPEIYVYSAGVRTEEGEEFCTAMPNDEFMQSKMDSLYFETMILHLRKANNRNGDPVVYLSRFDGKLPVNHGDQLTAGWMTTQE